MLPQAQDEAPSARPAADPLQALTSLIEEAHAAAPAELFGAVRSAARHLGARDVKLMLVDFAQQVLTPMPIHWGTQDSTTDSVPVDDLTAAGQAYLLGVPVVTSSSQGVRFCCPLLDGIERLGVLELLLDDGGEAMQDICRRFTEMVTQFLATKGRYTDEFHLLRQRRPMSLAAQLQWQTVPPVTAHAPAATVAAQIEPAYEVGGDAFDYAFNASRLHVAIFDAMGHGMKAGVTTALALGAYRNSRRQNLPLPEVLRRIDDVIAEEFLDDRFVTALLGELDYATGRLWLANAACPQPLLVRDGQIVPLPVTPPALPLGLGLREDLAPVVTEVTLRPGDLLLMVTDGILDARDGAGKIFGEPGLIRLVEQAARHGLPLAELARLITSGVHEFQNGKLRDDASLLIVEYFGLPGTRPPADTAPQI